jgi:hypothetical protein
MRSYCAKTNRQVQRKLVQYCVLIAANSDLRSSEELKLKWGDEQIEQHGGKLEKQ